jgi:hypothetical protein
VVETVTVWAAVPTGAHAFGWLSMDAVGADSTPGIAALTFNYQGVYDNRSLYTSSSPLKFRLDSSKNVLKANIFRIGANGASGVTVSIFGYLEDL